MLGGLVLDRFRLIGILPVTLLREVKRRCASQRKCSALDFLRYLITGTLLAQASASYAAGPPLAAVTAPGSDAEKTVPADRSFPWYIILNSPRDIDGLWQKIARPTWC